MTNSSCFTSSIAVNRVKHYHMFATDGCTHWTTTYNPCTRTNSTQQSQYVQFINKHYLYLVNARSTYSCINIWCYFNQSRCLSCFLCSCLCSSLYCSLKGCLSWYFSFWYSLLNRPTRDSLPCSLATMSTHQLHSLWPYISST